MILYFDKIKELKHKYNFSYKILYDIMQKYNTIEEVIDCCEKTRQAFAPTLDDERENKITRIIELVNATFDFTIADDCLDMLPKWTLIEDEPYLLFGLIDSYDDIYWICVNKNNLNKFACLPCYMHIDSYVCSKKFSKEEIKTIIDNHEKIMNHDKERMIYNKLIDKIYD